MSTVEDLLAAIADGDETAHTQLLEHIALVANREYRRGYRDCRGRALMAIGVLSLDED